MTHPVRSEFCISPFFGERSGAVMRGGLRDLEGHAGRAKFGFTDAPGFHDAEEGRAFRCLPQPLADPVRDPEARPPMQERGSKARAFFPARH